MAHFFFKRDEIKALVRAWVEEAEELATYEAYLCRKVELLRTAVAPLVAAEAAALAAAAAEERAAAAARVKAAREAAAAAVPPPGATAAAKKRLAAAAARSIAAAAAVPAAGAVALSAPLRRAADALAPLQAAYSRWLSDTGVPSHQVWQRMAPPADRARAAALEGRINATLARSDARAVAAFAAAPAGLSTAVAAAAASPWKPGPGAPGCGALSFGAAGYQPGAYQLASFNVSIDALKVSHGCTAFNLAVCMAADAAALEAALDKLKEEECLREEE